MQAAIRLAEELGAEIGETTLPRSVDYGLACYYLVAPGGGELEPRPLRRRPLRPSRRGADDLTALYERTRWEGFGEEPKRRILLGTYALSAGYYDAYYGQAQKVRTLIKDEFAAAFEDFDVLLSPTSPDGRVPLGGEGREPARHVPLGRAHDPAEHGRPAGPLDPVRPLRGPAGRPPDPRPAVLREQALPRRPRARARARLRLRPGAAAVTWEAVIGLEIHVQLKTRTKMFCRCANEWGAEPNTRTCPVCLAHPGTLPVPNGQAIEWAVKLGLALGCEIAPRALFHRKHYWYPDLPKGYQISQYDVPLCARAGASRCPGPDGDREIGIVRAHLEEDAAKTIHVGGEGGRIRGAGASLVDFNRGGTPLVEIVSEPDLRTPEEARRFLQLLRQTVVELGISDAEMEKGSLRCDANVSVRETGEEGFRTKTELKNMNSFKFVADGIAAELARQIEVYESGGEIVQETLHYDPSSGQVTPLRSKEYADDYRYFPEPDLVPVEPSGELVESDRRRSAGAARRADPPLRGAVRPVVLRRGRAERRRGARRPLRAGRRGRRGPEGGVQRAHEPVLRGRRRSRRRVNAAELAKLIEGRDSIPRATLVEALAASGSEGFSAERYLADASVSDVSELDPVIDRILAANEGQVAAYRAGKEGLLGFFVGQVMKETDGKANPKVVNERLRERLSA